MGKEMTVKENHGDHKELVETFRQRREAWAETAKKLRAGSGRGAPRVLNCRDEVIAYSYLGAGLQALIERDPGIIQWEEPETLRGLRYQTVMDTTETLAGYYGTSTEVIDRVDDMEMIEERPIRELARTVAQADYEFLVSDEAGCGYRAIRIPAVMEQEPVQPASALETGRSGRGEMGGTMGRTTWQVHEEDGRFRLVARVDPEIRPERELIWEGKIEIGSSGNASLSRMDLKGVVGSGSRENEQPGSGREHPLKHITLDNSTNSGSIREIILKTVRMCARESKMFDEMQAVRAEREEREERQAERTRNELRELARDGAQKAEGMAA